MSDRLDRMHRVLAAWRNRIESECRGRRGIVAKRHAIAEIQKRLDAASPYVYRLPGPSWRQRQTNKALGLARMAQMYFDEHGSTRGDYLTTTALDYVPPATSAAQYHDLGGAGLGLVEVSRKRVYASSSKWRPASSSSRYLVGRNEAGTFFAHAVPNTITTVPDALDWIWGGNLGRIITRQGDIALIWGRGPKLPPVGLPSGHIVQGSVVTHRTHPTIPAPGPGQRIIVGRRAAVRVSAETRD